MNCSSTSILSSNVRGINMKAKRHLIMQNIIKKKAEVILLQETRLKRNFNYAKLNKEMHNYNFYYNSTKTGAVGLMLLIKKDSNVFMREYLNCSDHLMIIKLIKDNTPFIIYNLQLPHSSKERKIQMKLIKSKITSESEPIFLIGDWNIAGTSETRILKQWAISNNLTELQTQNESNGMKEQFSFMRGISKSRLDRVFYSNQIQKISHLDFSPNICSDHMFMSFDINPDKGPLQYKAKSKSVHAWTPKWWLFNAKQIKRITDEAIEKVRKFKDKLTAPTYWSVLKMCLKQKLFEHQKSITQQLKDELNFVNNELIVITADPKTDNSIILKMKNRAIVLNNKLLKIYTPPSNNIYSTNNRVKLLKMMRKYGKEKNIIEFNALKISEKDRAVITNDKLIAEALAKEYQRRLQNQDINTKDSPDFPSSKENYRFFKNAHRLTENVDIENMNTRVTLLQYKEEIIKCDHSMLPGPDSLNSFFYSQAGDVVIVAAYEAIIYQDISNDRYNDDRGLEANLFPIPKRSHDGLNQEWKKVVKPEDIRFISLINCDIKAWTRCINKKLACMLPKIMHPLCFSTPTKNLQQAILLLQLISNEKPNSKKTKQTILKLDFQNAFDLTSRPHLLRHLRELIGESWTFQQVKMLINRCILVKFGSATSHCFEPTVGLLQGCPLSASLYTIYMNILASKCCRILKGVKIPNTNKHLRAMHYIDDLLIGCVNESDEKNAWRLLRSFQDATGARLNLKKTERIPLYDLSLNQGKRKKKISINKNNKVKVYGLYPFANIRTSSNKIFESIMKTVVKQTRTNRINFASLSSRVSIINTMFTSKFIYALPLMLLTASMKRKYLSTCNNFLWTNIVQVGIKYVSLPIEYGGLGLIHLGKLADSLKCNFYVKLKNSNYLNTEIKSALTEFYLKTFVKNDDLIENAIDYSSENNDDVVRIHYSEFAKGLANEEGFSLLPKAYIKLLKKLPLLPSIRSLLFKILWGKLPTAYYLHNTRHMEFIEDLCVCCNHKAPETWEHLFLECNSMKIFLQDIHNHSQINVDDYLIIFDPSRWSVKKAKIINFFALITTARWKARNSRMFISLNTKENEMAQLKNLLKQQIASTSTKSMKAYFPPGISLLM